MLRIGHGYDVHRFAENRELVLCGIKIPYEYGLLGHSDADVALHALMDSMLGALALGDIGIQFPDTDESFCGADSAVLLGSVVKLTEELGYSLGNCDITIIAQRPRLMQYILPMRKNIAKLCGVDLSCVSVKATTEEGLGFTGEGLGMAAHAVCIMQKNS